MEANLQACPLRISHILSYITHTSQVHIRRPYKLSTCLVGKGDGDA